MERKVNVECLRNIGMIKEYNTNNTKGKIMTDNSQFLALTAQAFYFNTTGPNLCQQQFHKRKTIVSAHL